MLQIQLQRLLLIQQSTINNTTINNKIINLYKNKTIVGTVDSSKLVYVSGYFDQNGNFIRPHYRTRPNSYIFDNLSYLGLSTLLPLDVIGKTKYRLSTNNNIKSIEEYLLYKVVEKGEEYFTNEIFKIIRNNSNDISREIFKPDNLILFYEKLGYNVIETKILVDYDINGELTPKVYIYSILSNYDIEMQEDLEWLYNYYAALLNLYNSNIANYNQVKNFAYNFYKFIGIPSALINEQVEMDLMQRLPSNSDYSKFEEKLLNLIFIDLSIDYDNDPYNSNFESYLIYKYSIYDFSQELALFKYYYQLEQTLNVGDRKLVNFYKSGYELYNQLYFKGDYLIEYMQEDIVLYFMNKD